MPSFKHNIMHSIKGWFVIFMVAVGLYSFIVNLPGLYAMYWSEDNATVKMTDCSEDCILEGTLRMTCNGEHYLVDNQGKKIYFDNNEAIISYPANN